MPVSFSLASLPKAVIASARKGTLTDDVLVQFLCNTGPGGQHDPDAAPDDRVRPSHAAFHGRIFKLSEAPVPPLDYGCRCAIRYIAREDTPAAEVLDETTDEEPVKPEVATAQWLDENVEGWRGVAKQVKESSPKDAIQAAVGAARDADIEQPRAIAEMIIDVIRSKLL